MSKKRSNYESSVFLRIYRGAKKVFFSFLAIFDKNTGHRVTKIYPDFRISITYKSYLITFSLTRKIILIFYIVRYFKVIVQRRQDGVVGRAVASKTQIPGSSPTAANFFFYFFSSAIAEDPHLRKAEDFFCQKSSAFC